MISKNFDYSKRCLNEMEDYNKNNIIEKIYEFFPENRFDDLTSSQRPSASMRLKSSNNN